MLTFRTLRSTVYVALPVPEQLPYSGYATACSLQSPKPEPLECSDTTPDEQFNSSAPQLFVQWQDCFTQVFHAWLYIAWWLSR